MAENCTGTGPACPADSFESSATVCRGSGGVCDISESCTGGGPSCPGDSVEPNSTVCRPAASTADQEESCDGSNKFCPADSFLPAGTPCNDGSFCTQLDEADGFGTCVGMDPVDCDDVNPCTDDSCDSQSMGFLCLHPNNGICIGANCGDFVVQNGAPDFETCDPPDVVPSVNGCRLDCTRCGDGVVQSNNTETCDDGNTISGCRTDKPQQPLDECLNNCNEPICADPARIKFGHGTQQDMFDFHGRLITPIGAPVDFINNHFVIELRDAADGVIFRASLVRGSLEVQNVKSVRYKNRGARAGGGIYQMKTKAGLGYFIVSLKAYGDLGMSVQDMTTHVYVGDEEWVVRGLWIQQSKGWKLTGKTLLEPVH